MKMTEAFKINGIIPIIPTPFTPEEQIDWPAANRVLDFAASIDVCGLCLPAYASEFYKLSDDERRRLIANAVEHVNGRKPIVAQANSMSAVNAADMARFAEKEGASAIALAVPRAFPVSENDLLRYFDVVLSAINIPMIIQDVNPHGATVSADFVARLHKQHPHFRWIKLEEPMLAGRADAVLEATSGAVGVLEGWGGMYIMELVRAGICGIMPGLGVADLLARIFRLAREKKEQEAYSIFQGILPEIVFSLQNMELYHHVEKRLLEARGVMGPSAVRELRLSLSAHDAAHIDFLCKNILALLDSLGMPRC